jgi:hypothetical protein
MLTTRRHDRRGRRQAGLLLESLDDRVLLSGGALGATAEANVHNQPAGDVHRNHDISPRDDSRDGLPATLPANVSAGLRLLYREYEGADSVLAIRGARVGVRIKVAFPPALGAYLGALRRDGLQVIRTVPDYGEVEGTLPVAKLPAVAQLAAHVWADPGLMR